MCVGELAARSGSLMLDTSRAAEVLNTIARDEHRFHLIYSAFREHIDARDDPVAEAVVWMLGYRFVDANDRSERDLYGPFKPDIQFPDLIFPPYLDEVGRRDDIRSTWGDLADLLEAPAIRARLHDLLWITDRGPDGHRHAISAIESYISAATAASGTDVSVEQRLDRADWFRRALELSHLLKASDLVERVCGLAAEIVANELADEDAQSHPGVWMPLLWLLASLDDETRPPSVREYVARAHALADRPEFRMAVFQAEQQLVRGDQDETDRLQQAEVEMLISHALQEENGLARQHWLTKAHERARGRRWAQEAEQRIVTELQRIDPDSYDWQTASAQAEIPAEEVEAVIESIAGTDDLDKALARFAFVNGVPVGEREDVERSVDAMAEHSLFVRLFNSSVVDERGLAIRRPRSPEEQWDIDILGEESDRIRWDSVFRALALDEVGLRHTHDVTALTDFFKSDFVDHNEAEAFARAFEHYWEGRPEEAILLALPKIEAVFRKLLEANGGVTYDPPRGDRPGVVRTLGAVLRDLERTSSGDMVRWCRFFRVALTESAPGLNLRNRYAHGLVARATKQDAAVVLRICTLLRFFGDETAEA